MSVGLASANDNSPSYMWYNCGTVYSWFARGSFALTTTTVWVVSEVRLQYCDVPAQPSQAYTKHIPHEAVKIRHRGEYRDYRITTS
jgi:hypothetical protein